MKSHYKLRAVIPYICSPVGGAENSLCTVITFRNSPSWSLTVRRSHWENMASHTSKAFLSLGRINVSGVGLQKSLSRATYATGVSTHTGGGNTGEFYCRC